MTSDLQSTLRALQFNDYTTLVAVAAIAYDYFLVFPKEVIYVWQQPWTWVSTIFVVVRYLGLSSAILESLWGATFGPGTVEVSTAIYLTYVWMSTMFLAAADLVMILRVYAMWNRSKWILYILLFIYVPQIIVSFVFTGVYATPNTYISVRTSRVIDFTFCTARFRNLRLILATHLYDGILRFVLSIAILTLAVVQTVRQSIESFEATKQWQPNKYMQQLTTDGILYFLAYVFFSIYAIVQNSATDVNVRVILSVVSYIVIITITPRFIISVRELYDRDIRSRWEVVDTGFGLSSQPVVGADTISDMDTNPGGRDGQVVEGNVGTLDTIRLEAMRDRAYLEAMEGGTEDSESTRLEDQALQA